MPWPAKINLDGNSATHRGVRLPGVEDGRWRTVDVRARRYLNNVVELDHRAIKQRRPRRLGERRQIEQVKQAVAQLGVGIYS